MNRFLSLVTRPSLRASVQLLAFVASAFVARLLLYFGFADDFRNLSFGQVLAAFAVGLRFDLSMAMVMAALPVLLLWLPFAWSQRRVWQGLWHWFIYLALLAFIFMMAVDLLYFGKVHRHVGSEVNTMWTDIGSMLGLVWRQYAWALALFGAVALGLGWCWRQLDRIALPLPQRRWPRLLGLPVVFVLMLVVARSGVAGKPISVGEAFFSDHPAQGYLALNGAFALSRALLESPPAPRSFMPDAEAVAEVQQYLAGDAPVFATPGFALHRAMRPASRATPPNVVVLMLESWGAEHIDALRRLQSQTPLGVTPNFDALVRQGRLYSRFYANGQRSLLGAQAILASQPTFAAMPFLGEGMEQNRQSFMGELARSQGYATYFLQSSERGSLRFDAIAARAGFATYRGAEDIANLHQQPKPANTWGTWDHNTLQAAHQLFAAARQPFLGFVFPSSTHTPWLIPDARFAKIQGGGERTA
ncbi:MAG: LTA synthase family protein, partial [Rhodoferax sp.]